MLDDSFIQIIVHMVHLVLACNLLIGLPALTFLA